MAHQSVLYPQGSLLIVDKGMRKRGGTQPYETGHFTLSDKDIKVSVLGGSTQASDLVKPQQLKPSNGQGNSRRFRFVDHSASACRGRKQTPGRRKRPAGAKREHEPPPEELSKHSSPSATASTSPSHLTVLSKSTPDNVRLRQTIPGSSSLFYGRYEKHASPSVADVLPFYGNMTYFFYPLQAHLPIKFDPVTEVYLPASLGDVCSLYAIVGSAASRLEGMHGWQNNDGAVFFQGASREIRRRISAGDITDAVLMAVTCFALHEHCRGRADASLTHITGMLQMLEVRGGINSVHPGFRQKIYRALCHCAVDYLSKPRWPRLERNTPTLHSTLLPGSDNRASPTLLRLQPKLDSALYEIMMRLHHLSDAVNHAIEHRIAVHPFSLDQDILIAQHDLLCRDDDDADLNTAFRLAALVFTKLLTREEPLPLLYAETIPTAMTTMLEKMIGHPEDTIFRFWCVFIVALGTRQPNNRKLLLKDLKQSSLSLRISAWEAARTQLRQIAWVAHPALDAIGFELWQLVGIEPQ